jgi:fibronectin type 3 domain-containing protein
LSGAALAAKKNEPVFLVSNSLSLSLLNYLKDQNVQYITAFGSTGAISSSVLNSLASPASGLSSNIPSIPSGLTATALSPSEIRLDWDSVSNASGYYIYRATSSAGTYNKIDSVTSSSYVDSNLTAERTYYYKIKAYNNYGMSDYSLRANATTDESYVLATPLNLSASALSSKEIELSWDSVSGASYYYIYRATSSTGSYTKIKTVSDVQYTDTGLTSEKTYYYKIQAYSSAGLSNYSKVVSAKTEAVGVPANLTATVLSNSEIELTWDPLSDAASYYVYRATSATGTYTKIKTVTVPNYTDTGLTSGKTYYYKVKAYNGVSLGAYSDMAEGTTE